jgi:uncharacterized membrane protein HdeD (DUF308 family)
MPRTDSTAEPSPQPAAGFPIASLALLITTCACLLASADIKRLHEQYQELSANDSWWFIILVGVAGLVGGFVGLIALFFSRTSWRVQMLAPPAGILAGETGLFILLAPGPVWRTTFAVCILLAAAILFRLDAD